MKVGHHVEAEAQRRVGRGLRDGDGDLDRLCPRTERRFRSCRRRAGQKTLPVAPDELRVGRRDLGLGRHVPGQSVRDRSPGPRQAGGRVSRGEVQVGREDGDRARPGSRLVTADLAVADEASAASGDHERSRRCMWGRIGDLSTGLNIRSQRRRLGLDRVTGRLEVNPVLLESPRQGACREDRSPRCHDTTARRRTSGHAGSYRRMRCDPSSRSYST